MARQRESVNVWRFPCPLRHGECICRDAALKAIQGQNDSFFSQPPYTCYLEDVVSVGD